MQYYIQQGTQHHEPTHQVIQSQTISRHKPTTSGHIQTVNGTVVGKISSFQTSTCTSGVRSSASLRKIGCDVGHDSVNTPSLALCGS